MQWQQYQQQVAQTLTTSKLIPTNLFYLEKILFLSLVVMAFLFSIDAFVGHDVGNVKEIRLAKLKAQEELMAARPN